MADAEKPKTIAVSERERKLLEMIRALGFGEISIYVGTASPSAPRKSKRA